jgi:WSC domain-containing protein
MPDRRPRTPGPIALLTGLWLALAGMAGADSLDSNLNRLFETWRARNMPSVEPCTAWRAGLDQSQRMVFLTITHRLTHSRLSPVAVPPNSFIAPLKDAYQPDGRTPLDNIGAVYAIAGGHGPVAGPGDRGSCGGSDNNRLFMSMSYPLWLAFCLANVTHEGNPGPLLDPANNRAWRDSSDLGGPHDPFEASDETSYGSPRGQVHFWPARLNAEGTYQVPPEPASTPIYRRGVEGITDPYMVEMDQDYNFIHDSNPLCDDFLETYVQNHGNSGPEPINLNWEPAACRASAPGYQGCFTDDGNRALPAWLGEGHTIESCVAEARTRGYVYAGLQWYGQCFAGNVLGYSRVSDAECNTPCNAAPWQTCGGAWRNSIYATGGGPPPPGGSDILSPDQSLFAGGSVTSSDGRFTLVYQGDGHLVLYQNGVGPIWASGTAGTSPGRATMQGDGNFVIYDAGGTPLWHTGTAGNPGAYLKVQSDGNVVVYSAGGAALWSTGTCCR